MVGCRLVAAHAASFVRRARGGGGGTGRSRGVGGGRSCEEGERCGGGGRSCEEGGLRAIQIMG